MDEVMERKAAEQAQARIVKYDRVLGLYNESTKPDDEQLRKLPAYTYQKKREIYEISCKINEAKGRLGGMEKDEKYRVREANSKFTVEQAEHEALKNLRRQAGYRKLKERESDLHRRMNELVDERDFLIDTKECIEIRRR